MSFNVARRPYRNVVFPDHTFRLSKQRTQVRAAFEGEPSLTTRYLALLTLGLALATTAMGVGPPNSWIDGNGKGEKSNNWSRVSAPSLSDAADLITNAVNNTVTINATTTNSPGTLTISNLTVGALSGTINTLTIFDAGTNTPLVAIDGLTVTNGGILTVTNSALQVYGIQTDAFLVEGQMLMLGGASVFAANADVFTGMRVGGNPGSSGTLTVAGGSLTVSANLYAGHDAGSMGTIWVTDGNIAVNQKLDIGLLGTGQMTISNGTVSTVPLIVGELSGSQGTLNIAGGTVSVIGDVMVIGRLSGATGSVWMTGGLLTESNDLGEIGIEIGGGGVGQLTISNGTVRCDQIGVGDRVGGVGTFTIAGGTVTGGIGLFAGAGDTTSTGTVWMTGGTLMVSNEFLDIGFQGFGQMIISNGSVTATNMTLGDRAGSQGVCTIVGGSLTLSGAFFVGAFPGSEGTLTIEGGSVVANSLRLGTNSNTRGTLSLLGGTLTVPSDPSGGIRIGDSVGATGMVVVVGGQLVATNFSTLVGSLGVGQMMVSD